MAKPKFKEIKLTPKQDLKPIEVFFNRLDASHRDPQNRLLHWMFVPMTVLGVYAFLWAMPFPHIKFLGDKNQYINWASVFIAVSVYCYLRLTPLFSYIFLFMLMVFSFIIMQLSAWEAAGGVALWQISFVITLLGLGGQYFGGIIERNKKSFSDDIRLIAITPLWTLYNLLKRFGLKY